MGLKSVHLRPMPSQISGGSTYKHFGRTSSVCAQFSFSVQENYPNNRLTPPPPLGWVGAHSGKSVIRHCKQSLNTSRLITVRNIVAARLCFHRRLWFCSGGIYPSMHLGKHPSGQTPRADTPRQTPPLGRQTPLGSACWDTHPLPSACWDGIHTPCQVHAGIHTHPWAVHAGIHAPCHLHARIHPPGCWDTLPCPVHAGIHLPCPVHAGIHTHPCPVHAGIHPLPNACWDTPPTQCMLGYTPYPVHAGIHPPAQCMLGYTPLPSACWDAPPCPVHAGIHTDPCPVHAGIHPLPSACWDTPPPSACWDTPPVHAGIHPPLPLQRTVHILLECILVRTCRRCNQHLLW